MLIDGHSMAFRAFYALPTEKFTTTTTGQATNAIYGFLSMLATLLHDEQPTHVAVAFDVGRTTFRTEMFPDYKAQRDETPPEFISQIPILKNLLAALGITTIEKPNYEADDIIATLATTAQPLGFETLIVTGDRDSLQLVNNTTTVLYPMKGVSVMHRFTPQAVQDKYGLTPEQYPDFAALRGDPSDNLPSVPKVGEKTATKWIVQYGNLTNLLNNADTIKGVVGTNLRERIDQVKLNRQLTEMVKNLDLPHTPPELKLQPINTETLTEDFNNLEFGTTLRTKILKARGVTVDTTATPPQTPTTVDTIGVAKWLKQHPTEAMAVHITGRGITLGGIAHDTALAAYLLNPGQRTYDLKTTYQRHLHRTLEITETGQLSLLDITNTNTLITAAAAILELAATLPTKLATINELELYLDLELPLTTILAEMEATGIAVDIPTLEEQLDTFTNLVTQEETAARTIAGDPNLLLTSPKQLQVVLFETLGLPKTKKIKTGYSTAAKEIETLAANHPHEFLNHLLAHREYQKMKTTLEGLIKAVGDDGRIHTTFQQTMTSTGRLSSTDPNLQNIPIRTPAGKKIRSAFTVGTNYETLLTADYSQIEMRVMAHLSNDPGLITAYNNGEDLHNYVGAKVFEVPPSGVTPELRRKVKALSYGLVYGLSAFGLSQQLNIPAGEAKQIMENYFHRFGGVKHYLDTVVTQARKDGYTATLFDRRRYLPELTSTNRATRENAERAALNAPIQGTAADIIKIAMLRIHHELKKTNAKSRVLLQVHDELVVEIAPGELTTVKKLIEHEMDNAITLKVPLEVSTGHGPNWDAAAH